MTVFVSAVAVAALAMMYGLIQGRRVEDRDCAACRKSESASCNTCSGHFEFTESHDA